jgi:cytochrome c-type biogenesis protein
MGRLEHIAESMPSGKYPSYRGVYRPAKKIVNQTGIHRISPFCGGHFDHNSRYRGCYGRSGDLGKYVNYFVAPVFFVVGLHLLGVIPMPWAGPGQVGMKRRGMLAAFILGLVFGIALGPCTFAFMAPMLGITFKLAATSLFYAVLLLTVYGLGHCSVIVLAGTCTELVQHYMNWNEKSKGAVILRKICGILVLTGGLYLIYISP